MFAAAFLSNLSPEFLAQHQALKTWLPPCLAGFSAISYKLYQINQGQS